MKKNHEQMQTSQTLSSTELSENDQKKLSDILGDIVMNLTLLYFVALFAELSTIYS